MIKWDVDFDEIDVHVRFTLSSKTWWKCLSNHGQQNIFLPFMLPNALHINHLLLDLLNSNCYIITYLFKIFQLFK